MTTFRVSTIATAVMAIVMMGLFAARRSQADESMPQVGQQAPAFILPSQDGSPVSLDHYRGKWVVLYFYPKDQTTGCTIEAHNFQQDQSKFDAAHAVILGVSVDTVDSHKTFCTKDGLTFKLLADPDKKVVKEYGSVMPVVGMAKRNTFLIDPQGRIVKVWTGVDPSHHSQEVLDELKMQEKKS